MIWRWWSRCSPVLEASRGRGLIINRQSLTWQDLTPRLIDIYKTRAQKVLFVKADDGVPGQDVATVISEAHNAGVDRVGLIIAKIEGPG